MTGREQTAGESAPALAGGETFVPSFDYGARMSALALSFPSLRQADGLAPWEPERFAQWMRSGAPGHGAKCAGQFVLGVWNPSTRWKGGGRFDLHEALTIWDEDHRTAFLAWARAPWWP
jgi:hypothetical protein